MGAAPKIDALQDLAIINECCAIVTKRTGIQLGEKQRDMVAGRLQRRILELGLPDFSAYGQYLRANEVSETQTLVSLLTTHHTYFFRESSQFDLLEKALPAMAKRIRERGGREIEVWSAACSRGQEVYTLAMHLEKHWAPTGLGYRILGTDVDPESVDFAANGVYEWSQLQEVPLSYLGDHWQRGTGEISRFVKAKKSIRANCEFAVGNLLDLGSIGTRKFDVIFCRNVFIYFTPTQIKSITTELLKHLHPGGLLAIGLSESMHGLGLAVETIGPSVYVRREDIVKAAPAPAAKPTPLAEAKPLRVVCIDDSPTVLALLKKILTKELGFEVVGTGANGDLGAEAVKRLKPDLVTLDVHMPVCDGLAYLQRHHGAGSPPVVMVTSVSRDDIALAQGALKLGASDFVEKPALNNLAERGEELRSKLKAAMASRRTGPTTVGASFAKTIGPGSPAGKARILACSPADLPRALTALKSLATSPIPTWLAIDASAKELAAMRDRVQTETGFSTAIAAAGDKAEARKLLIGTPSEVAASVAKTQWRKISVLSYGAPKPFLSSLRATAVNFIFEEGFTPTTPPIAGARVDSMQPTSFVYMSDRFFGEEG